MYKMFIINMKKESKKIIVVAGIIIATILGVFAILNLDSDKEIKGTNKENKPKVAATIFPIYDITRQIGGEDLEVVSILPPGGSPHYFEVNPSLLKNLKGTGTIFMIGQELDGWVEKIVDNIDSAELVDLSQSINLKEFEEHDDHEEHEEEGEHHEDEHEEHADHDHHEHEEIHEDHHDEESHHEDHDDHEGDHEHEHEHAHGENDPHYWLSPDNAKVIANVIYTELSEDYPALEKDFRVRRDLFINELETKNKEWKEKIAKVNNKNLVTFHDAFDYFADHFGLNILATFEPFAGKEPTPKYLANLEHIIEEKNIKAMYVEPQFSAASLESFANDNNVSLGILDPLGGEKERQTYIDLIDYNVNSIINTQK